MLAELGIDQRDVDPVDLGRRGALLAAADLVWARQRTKRGTLLAVRGGDGQLRFPAFQFGPTGKPLPGLGAILAVLLPVVATPYTIASWFVTGAAELEGMTPASWLREGREPDRALVAAHRYAVRLAQ